MLSLRLKPGEYFTIGKDITVQVFQDRGNSIEVAIDAPRELPVLRGKLFEQTENARRCFTMRITSVRPNCGAMKNTFDLDFCWS